MTKSDIDEIVMVEEKINHLDSTLVLWHKHLVGHSKIDFHSMSILDWHHFHKQNYLVMSMNDELYLYLLRIDLYLRKMDDDSPIVKYDVE